MFLYDISSLSTFMNGHFCSSALHLVHGTLAQVFRGRITIQSLALERNTQVTLIEDMLHLFQFLRISGKKYWTISYDT